jgi:ABC-type amino acid transport substrate-binding protein
MNRKLSSCIGYFLLVFVFLITACSSMAETKQAPLSEFDLVEPGVLTIGADAAYPPHTYLDADTKQLVGLDVDLANEIGERLGLEVKFVTIEWKGIIPALQAKRFDIITAEMNITEERKSTVDFSDVVFTSGHVLVVRSDNKDIHKPEDLTGRIVLVPIGTTEEQEAKKYTENVKTYSLLSECFRELQLGRGDAIIVELSVASEYIKKSGGALKVVSGPWTETQSAFAFRKDTASIKLREAINKTLSEMRSDGTYDLILSHWIVKVDQ